MMRFLQRESKTVIGAAVVVGLFSFVSRMMGFARDRILAGVFGAGDTLDVYYAAFRLPDLLFQLIVVGALSASFIPLFLAQYQRPTGKQRAWQFTSAAVQILGGGMVVLTVVLFFLADPLAPIIAPGFSELKQQQTAEFMRVMLVAQLFLAISMIYGSVLQSLKKFLLYALAPIFYNVGIIVGALVLVKSLGPIGLAWGVVLGAILHFATQWIGVRESGYKFSLQKVMMSEDVRKMLRLMGPRSIGLAVNQLMFLLLTIMASTLAVGSVTVFQFAYNIEFFPVGILGVSFAIAIFPTLSIYADKQDIKAFSQLLSKTIRQLIYLLLPMTALFLIFRAQIVRVVVGAGAFDWAATIATADTLAFFALTFIPQAVVFVLARGFYALHDTITPLVIAVVSAMTGILSAFLLKDTFGVVALAMAFSLASLVNTSLLWVSLRQRLGSLQEAEFIPFIMKLSVAIIVSGVVMQLLKPVVGFILPLQTFFGILFQAVIAGGVGLLLYLLLAHILRVQEQMTLFLHIRRKLMQKAQPQEIDHFS